MTIVQILPQLNIGGVERGTIDFALYLKNKGHRSIVISAGGRLVSDLEQHGIQHYTLPVDKKNIFSMIYCIREVKKILLKEKVDIIHGRSRVPDWIAFWASLKTTTKLMITAHGCHSYHLFSKVINLSKFIIVPSATTARYFVDQFKVSDSKLNVIYRGLDLEKFKYVDPKTKIDNFNIAYVGRLSPIKGVEYLIDAVNEVLREYPQVQCRLIGAAHPKHKKYETFLRDKVKRMGLEKHITFCGIRNVEQELNDIKVLVLPSLVPETFGRVLTEAGAKGVACISTDLGAPKEIIENNKNGILVPAFDASGISDAIKKYFYNNEFYVSIVENAYEQIKANYTLEAMCASTVEIYNKVLKRKDIVVAKLASLGDIVLATASLKALRNEYPEAHISVIVEKRFFKILSTLDIIDEVLIFDQDKNPFKEILRITSLLRKRSIDLYIDIQNNTKSQLISFMSFPKKSIGVKRKYSFLHDIIVDYDLVKDLSPLKSQSKILEPLSLKESIDRPYLKADENMASHYRTQLNLNDQVKIIGINMGSSIKWTTKDPSIELYKNFIHQMNSEPNIRYLIIGTKEYLALAQELSDEFPESVINYCGKTSVHELISLMSLCNVFITPDSAPLHISIALNIPCLAFFGPTDPSKHIDIGNDIKVTILQNYSLDCLGCYNKTCDNKKCMQLSVETIVQTVKKYLGS